MKTPRIGRRQADLTSSPPLGLGEAAQALSDKAVCRNSHWYMVPKICMDALRAALDAQLPKWTDTEDFVNATLESFDSAPSVMALKPSVSGGAAPRVPDENPLADGATSLSEASNDNPEVHNLDTPDSTVRNVSSTSATLSKDTHEQLGVCRASDIDRVSGAGHFTKPAGLSEADARRLADVMQRRCTRDDEDIEFLVNVICLLKCNIAQLNARIAELEQERDKEYKLFNAVTQLRERDFESMRQERDALQAKLSERTKDRDPQSNHETEQAERLVTLTTDEEWMHSHTLSESAPFNLRGWLRSEISQHRSGDATEAFVNAAMVHINNYARQL